MAVGVIPTFHVGMRGLISDPDSIVNYVVRHVLMNPGSITSLHSDDEVSVQKIQGDYTEVSSALADYFRNRIQSILDRYATAANNFVVAVEYIDNNDNSSATLRLAIKATWNNKLISYDREFLIDKTADFRTMIIRANSVSK